MEQLDSTMSRPHEQTTSNARGLVLVVDDNEYCLHAIVEILKQRYLIRRASTADEALLELRREPRPDLVLLDVVLPDMGFSELLGSIKADPDTASIPVIAVGTGSMMKEDEELVWKLGACDYIQKHAGDTLIHDEDLLNKIECHIG